MIYIFRSQLDDYSGAGLPLFLNLNNDNQTHPKWVACAHFILDFVFFLHMLWCSFTVCIFYDIPVTFV